MLTRAIDAEEPIQATTPARPWAYLETLGERLARATPDAIGEFRSALEGGDAELKSRFAADEPVEALVRDRLAPRSGGRGLFRRVLKITGRTESDVDATVQPIYGRWASQDVPISTTILAVLGQIELHLTAAGAERTSAERALDSAVRELQAALGDAVYSVDGRGLEAVVAAALVARRTPTDVAALARGRPRAAAVYCRRD